MENIERSPLSSVDAEKFDAKGNPKMAHEMPDGTTFYGSQEEYAEELRKLREEAKM